MTRKGRPVIGSRLTGLVAGVDTLNQPAGTHLPVDRLQPGQFQPRVYFAPDALADLTRSVREQGVLQPLLVRPLSAGQYEIVAGERRWRAAQQAGLTEVPVLIRDLTDHEARMAAAIENLQRENLNVIEEVRARLQVAAATLNVPEGEAVARMFAIDRHAERESEAVEALDAAFGALGRESWRSFIRNRAPVLNLPADVQEAVRGGLDYRKALIVGRVKNDLERQALLVGAQDATVQELRALVSPVRVQPQDTAYRLGRVLSDRRTLAALPTEKRRKVERLLRQLEELLSE